jgi:hypothetical protein
MHQLLEQKKGDSVANQKTRPMSVTHPRLAAELHPFKNANLTYYGNSIEAKELVAGTMKRLWWKCSKITPQGLCDHEWIATGNDRSHKHRPTGCPACSNKAVHIDGRNSMRATHPELASELLPNDHGTADTLIAGTNNNLPWKCSDCRHEWITAGAERSHKHRPTGCPVCAPTGFDPSIPGQYYVIAILSSGDTIMYKAGISNNYRNRFRQHERKFRAHDRSKEWELKLIEVEHHELGKDSRKLESFLLLREEIRAPEIEDLSSELFNSNPLDLARELGLV